MTDFTDYTPTAKGAIADGLRQAKDINLASLEVFRSLTSFLAPLSVVMLPKSEELVPTIDTVVDRSFDTVVKVVEWQYGIGVAALDQLGSAAASS